MLCGKATSQLRRKGSGGGRCSGLAGKGRFSCWCIARRAAPCQIQLRAKPSVPDPCRLEQGCGIQGFASKYPRCALKHARHANCCASPWGEDTAPNHTGGEQKHRLWSSVVLRCLAASDVGRWTQIWGNFSEFGSSERLIKILWGWIYTYYAVRHPGDLATFKLFLPSIILKGKIFLKLVYWWSMKSCFR